MLPKLQAWQHGQCMGITGPRPFHFLSALVKIQMYVSVLAACSTVGATGLAFGLNACIVSSLGGVYSPNTKHLFLISCFAVMLLLLLLLFVVFLSLFLSLACHSVCCLLRFVFFLLYLSLIMFFWSKMNKWIKSTMASGRLYVFFFPLKKRAWGEQRRALRHCPVWPPGSSNTALQLPECSCVLWWVQHVYLTSAFKCPFNLKLNKNQKKSCHLKYNEQGICLLLDDYDDDDDDNYNYNSFVRHTHLRMYVMRKSEENDPWEWSFKVVFVKHNNAT